MHTTGTQAYGAAVDDGGSLYLEGLSVKTEGQYAMGLYAGIGTLKPGQVSLVAHNVSVQTLGDQATGAMVSRQYQSDTASLQLSDSSITTSGALSHGLQAESTALLSASNTTVTTHGERALGRWRTTRPMFSSIRSGSTPAATWPTPPWPRTVRASTPSAV